MFISTTPENAGISSKTVLKFLNVLENYGFSTHSVIMARGNKIFTECYYKPFDKNFKHRMYSVSKSFVAIAVGLAEEGLLSLDDRFVDYFPEYINENTNELLRETTIRDMLRMETALCSNHYWFNSKTDDRVKEYFIEPANIIPGTMYFYDSPGSYMLGVIVEKLTGKTFLEYMQEKFLSEIGFSKDAYCIKAPGGYSFGDSGVMCTSRDLLIFAKFVMNKGVWNGKRYMNEKYLSDATSYQVCNGPGYYGGTEGYGYGYQIRKTPGNGFMFLGMGDQIAICEPETDFIFVITSDNQGNTASRPILYHELYNRIIPALGDPMEEDQESYSDLLWYTDNASLIHLKENYDNPFVKEIENVTYCFEKNPMNIEYIKFNFDGKKGTLTYRNAQGDKRLYFGIGYNEFGYFPEEGYSDMVATEYVPGNMYRCACSADWPEEKKLRIKVQIIDKYFGNGCFIFSFKDDRLAISMLKNAEAFMDEYSGIANGKKTEVEI